MGKYVFGGHEVGSDLVLNEEQVCAMERIVSFIDSPGWGCMTLMGFAGTGKTTLMGLVHDIYYFGRPVQFSATTHKAAGVLKGRVGERVFTVNSLFGIMVEQDFDADNFDVSVKKRTDGDSKLRRNGVVVIDEASMLSEENFHDVMDKAEEYCLKVLFVGDPAQLAPVGEDDVSVVFRSGGEEPAVLRKIERTGDNGILGESMLVRNTGEWSREDSHGVRFVAASGGGAAEVFRERIPGLESDPNFFRVLSYTNKNVEAVNTAVRRMLGRDGVPVEGEPMMGYSNWGYDPGRRECPYRFVNSEGYKVVEDLGWDEQDVSELGLEDGLVMKARRIVLADSLGLRTEVPFIDVKSDPENLRAARVLAHRKKELWQRWREGGRKDGKLIARIGEIDEMLFVNDGIRDGLGFLLQAKVIDFGYAHTIHKSQGSTFRHVLINDPDIMCCTDGRTRRQLRYVAVTRASESATIIVRG